LSNNYYETLGVNKDASPDEIKSAYRKLAMEHHPDKGGDGEKFKSINEAYEILSNPERRSQYDNPMPRGFGIPDFDNFFNFFHQQRQQSNPNAPRRGQDIRLEREIPIKFFILGGKLKIHLTYPDICQSCSGRGATEFEVCSACGGSGSVTMTRGDKGVVFRTVTPCVACGGRGQSYKNICGNCNGSGNVKVENKEINIEIPAGFRDRDHMVIPQAGRSGFNGGPPGDLILFLIMRYPNPEELNVKQRKVLEEI
jgi:molecular chaperone DnaJ